MDWYDKEIEALEYQLENGQITQREFNREVRLLNQDFEEQQYIQDMKDAGRGYLLR